MMASVNVAGTAALVDWATGERLAQQLGSTALLKTAYVDVKRQLDTTLARDPHGAAPVMWDAVRALDQALPAGADDGAANLTMTALRLLLTCLASLAAAAKQQPTRRPAVFAPESVLALARDAHVPTLRALYERAAVLLDEPEHRPAARALVDRLLRGGGVLTALQAMFRYSIVDEHDAQLEQLFSESIRVDMNVQALYTLVQADQRKVEALFAAVDQTVHAALPWWMDPARTPTDDVPGPSFRFPERLRDMISASARIVDGMFAGVDDQGATATAFLKRFPSLCMAADYLVLQWLCYSWKDHVRRQRAAGAGADELIGADSAGLISLLEVLLEQHPVWPVCFAAFVASHATRTQDPMIERAHGLLNARYGLRVRRKRSLSNGGDGADPAAARWRSRSPSPDQDQTPMPPPAPPPAPVPAPAPVSAERQSYRLPTAARVYWIDQLAQIDWLRTALMLQPTSDDAPPPQLNVGIDLEWRSPLGRVRVRGCALMQIAVLGASVKLVDEPLDRRPAGVTLRPLPVSIPADFIDTMQVCLIDVALLPPDAVNDFLRDLFVATHVNKIGFSFDNDVREIVKSFPRLRDVRPQPMTDLETLMAPRKRRPTAPADPAEVAEPRPAEPDVPPDVTAGGTGDAVAAGLKGVVERWLGCSLDKRQQLSDWRRRPLLDSQQTYAACDAACLVELYSTYRTRHAAPPAIGSAGAGDEDPHGGSDRGAGSSADDRGEADDARGTASSARTAGSAAEQPVKASSLRIVADVMLARLARKLRICGIDTVYLHRKDTDQLVATALAEDRYLLTRGRMFAHIAKQLPEGRAVRVAADTTNAQLAEVLQRFRVQLQPFDLFSRCPLCNGKAFASRSCEYVAALPDLGGVPPGVLERLRGTGMAFFQCTVCSKLFWEGRHVGSAFDTFFQSLLPDAVVRRARELWGLEPVADSADVGTGSDADAAHGDDAVDDASGVESAHDARAACDGGAHDAPVGDGTLALPARLAALGLL